MWNDFISEDTLIIFITGMYFWGWVFVFRFKFSNKINLLHFILFLFFFLGWILQGVDADWIWLLEPEVTKLK